MCTCLCLLRYLLLLIACFYCAALVAQEPQRRDSVAPMQPADSTLPINNVTLHDDYASKADLIDLLYLLLKKENKRTLKNGNRYPGKPHLSLLPGFGYTLHTGFAGVIASNAAFYTGISKIQKISSIKSSLGFTQRRQFIIPFQVNIWTRDNKYNIIGNWRFLKYPSFTYGLGGNSRVEDKHLIDFSYLRLYQSMFRSIGHNFYAGFGYYLDRLWNIRELDSASDLVTDFQSYGLNKMETASGPVLRFLYDSRLNQINPKQGFYSNIVYRNNHQLFASKSNWQSLLADFRKYIPLGSSTHHVLAIWSQNWLTLSGTPPYLLLPSTGWDDPGNNTGRGYVQGRFRSKNMLYLETEYRFGISRNGLFGGVVFANVQSFSENINFNKPTFAPAIGSGIRIKINKFSGSNICLDYGFGLRGSSGIFVNLTEVF